MLVSHDQAEDFPLSDYEIFQILRNLGGFFQVCLFFSLQKLVYVAYQSQYSQHLPDEWLSLIHI